VHVWPRVLSSIVALVWLVQHGSSAQVTESDFIRVLPQFPLAAAPATSDKPRVRFVYMVPTDREVRPEYAAAIESAVRNLRWWYFGQLDRQRTFALVNPAVAIVRTAHEADWYKQTRTGGAADFFFNVAEEGYALIGGYSADRVTIFYIDADQACGQFGGAGGGGLAVIAANDLRGLTGQPTIAICPGQPPDRLGLGRWIGGLGHELGHALGLPHPADCDKGLPTCDIRALMWSGYSLYPFTYFRADEKAALRQSPFIVPTPEQAPPFGSVDTPIDGASVAGEVGVTGWVLDDSGIQAVSVYRNPVGGEPTHANGLVFVGNATLVRGARPDVQSAYPVYPDNDRAGWGYMVLSNMLPRTVPEITLSIFAQDTEGTTRLLGTRRIRPVNQTSQLPFGTIDVPGQGATVSGTVIVFGWALTPQPNAIPLDGSTIDVLVDGAAIGHPTYNQFRADIATLFPGLKNSDGAVGYFVLDTTKLTNGFHTIAWVVRDDAGNTSGMGSRFFEVNNSAVTSLSMYTNTTDAGILSAALANGQTVEFLGAKDERGFATTLSHVVVRDPSGSLHQMHVAGDGGIAGVTGPRLRLGFVQQPDGRIDATARGETEPTVAAPWRPPSATARAVTAPTTQTPTQASIVTAIKGCAPTDDAVVSIEVTGSALGASRIFRGRSVGGPGLYEVRIPVTDPNVAASGNDQCSAFFSRARVESAFCDVVGQANGASEEVCATLAAGATLIGQLPLATLISKECRPALLALNGACAAIEAGPSICSTIATASDRALTGTISLRPTVQFPGSEGGVLVVGEAKQASGAGPFPSFEVRHPDSVACDPAATKAKLP
jgi:hypothetical protein